MFRSKLDVMIDVVAIAACSLFSANY
jgi:hypothetical protein